jgi:hypothetical protein
MEQEETAVQRAKAQNFSAAFVCLPLSYERIFSQGSYGPGTGFHRPLIALKYTVKRRECQGAFLSASLLCYFLFMVPMFDMMTARAMMKPIATS